VTFPTVTTPGITVVASSPTGPPAPANFEIVGGTYYDIHTTAAFTPPATICITNMGVTAALQLQHYDSTLAPPQWVDITVLPVNVATQTICGQTETFSPFAIMQPINQPPVANAGPDRIVECGTTVTLDGSDSTDPDGDALTYTWTGPFGAATGTYATVTLPPGEHGVTLTVADGRGGTSSDEVIVVVRDTAPPSLKLTLSPTILWPPNHELRTVSAAVQAVDTCDATPRIELLSITSNEPDNGTGDGDVAGDIQGAAIGGDSRTFEVRAERAGGGSGRSYAIVYRATDRSGNATTASAVVAVPHDRSR
jgi:hypothetical protein